MFAFHMVKNPREGVQQNNTSNGRLEINWGTLKKIVLFRSKSSALSVDAEAIKRDFLNRGFCSLFIEKGPVYLKLSSTIYKGKT